MGVAYKRGQTLGPSDLEIVIRDSMGVPINPVSIDYSIFDFTTGVEVLIGAPNQIPITVQTGYFYVDWTIPLGSNIGDWVIRWNFKEVNTAPTIQVAQKFNVVDANVVVAITETPSVDLLINRLRVLLRDNNPDRNYRFRPPASEKFLQSQTQVFGYIWEDAELLEYLNMAVDDFNTRPPVTGIQIDSMPDRWRTSILLRAGAFAMFAITLNWIADEFSLGPNEYVVVKDENGNEHRLTMKELFDITYGEKLKEIDEQVKKEILEFMREEYHEVI
jgi:hypothetical protein